MATAAAASGDFYSKRLCIRRALDVRDPLSFAESVPLGMQWYVALGRVLLQVLGGSPNRSAHARTGRASRLSAAQTCVVPNVEGSHARPSDTEITSHGSILINIQLYIYTPIGMYITFSILRGYLGSRPTGTE